MQNNKVCLMFLGVEAAGHPGAVFGALDIGAMLLLQVVDASLQRISSHSSR